MFISAVIRTAADATFRASCRQESQAMSLDPHIAALVVSCSAAALLMAIAGVRKNGLEWRQRRRICPSCGRELRFGACGCRS